jgi:hypothetical protein
MKAVTFVSIVLTFVSVPSGTVAKKVMNKPRTAAGFYSVN